MALDLRSLRSAAARETRDRDRAQERLAAAIERGEALRAEDASTATIRRADEQILVAAGNLHQLPDRIRDALDQATPDEVLGALERDIPLVLLPVRLEAQVRRRAGGWSLWVRVFPDALHTDAHELELTAPEREIGEAFWARPSVERDTVWVELAHLLGPQRASWVAEATRTGATAANAPERFTRPAWTNALPDRFLFSVRADGIDEPVVEGARIRTPLATGPDPRLVPDADDGTDAGMRWMTDFSTAVDQGMAARIRLGINPPGRIDQVLVLGVRASVTPGDAATLLGDLVDAHRYGDRLEVLRVGTPTNAGADGTPGGSRASLEATPTPVARTIASGTDGALLARALGVEPADFAGVVGADGTSDADAQAMLTALWPGTLGYFLRQTLAGSIAEHEAALLRAHAVSWVRGRGPLAPLRVGRTPYGVLPATSLAHYAPDSSDPPEAGRFVDLLRRMLPTWAEASAHVPRVGRGSPSKASETLAQILGLAPVSLAIDARRVYPEGVVDILTTLSGMTDEQRQTTSELRDGLVRAGFTELGELADGDDLQRLVASAGTRRVTIPRVQTAPLSPREPLVDNYLDFLRTETPDRIARAEEEHGAPLLYLLARAAILQQYAVAATESTGLAAPQEAIVDRHVIVDLPEVPVPTLALDLLAEPTPQLPGSSIVVRPLGQELRDEAGALAEDITMGGSWEQPLLAAEGDAAPGAAGSVHARISTTDGLGLTTAELGAGGGLSETAQVLAALAHLAPLPTATLDRLLRETLDLASHRLDAWVTSLATKRLMELRADHPVGAHLGAYGVVRDLVPQPPGTTLRRPPGSPTGTPDAATVSNQGFVHAPSLGHAATAAVLRSAHAAHGEGDAFAVSLESARVRCALALLDGVRQGQSLSVLLGYQLERTLLDRGAATAIAKLRDAAPIRTTAVPPAGGSFETIAPRDVVDGLRVADDSFKLPTTLTGAESAAVTAARSEVRDALDATGDLLLAEGVHQLVAGTPARAAAATRAAAGMGPPPDQLEVVQTPRGGTGVTHRVLLVSDASSDTWVRKDERTPRVLADPLLEGFAAGLLGAPTDYGALVRYRSADGDLLHPTIEVDVEELGIGALDAVAMSGAPSPGQSCELERRVLDRAGRPDVRPRTVPVDAHAEMASRDEHVAASSRAPLADLIVAANAVGDLLRLARVPEPHEIDPSLGVGADGYDVGELARRLADLRTRTEEASSELGRLLDRVDDEAVDLDELLGALRRASLLVSAALPEVADATRDRTSRDEGGRDLAREILVAQGRGIRADLERRLEIAQDLLQSRSLGPGTTASVTQRQAVADVLLDGAPRMAPVLAPSLAASMRDQLDAPPSLGPGIRSAGDRGSVIRAFLAEARRVRKPVARLDRAEALAVALGSAPLTLQVAQLGTAVGALWGALPQQPVPGGITSVVLAGDAAFHVSTPVGALTVDDWTEIVPSAQEVTALAVHTDRPGNDAPQAVLVAVPPDPTQAWSVAMMRAVVEETLGLAEMRMVDPPALGGLGHLLPALLLACTGRQGQIKVPERLFFPKAKH